MAQSFTHTELEILTQADGKHETQVSEGGEADLHKHYANCKKNPGHTEFLPVKDLKINHLPGGYRDNDIVELINATADLTVRVDVKMTSAERPEFWPNTTTPYVFYNLRGCDAMRVGTGKLSYVNVGLGTEEVSERRCYCRKCQLSDTPSKVWGEISMYTATHVVFDNLEARHTTCTLFYDREDSPRVTLGGWTLVQANVKEDRCWLKCVTCDVGLLDKLDKKERHWDDLWDKVNNRYKSSREKDKLSFIVSHPHGCPKQVSIGRWINRREVKWYVIGFTLTQYTYTTCTCPGSSGAHVHSLGYNELLYDGPHVHSGVCAEGTNFSGAGREML